MIKKADIVLFTGLMLISLALLFSFILIPRQKGDTLVVTVDGVEFCRAELKENKTIEIGENLIIIEDGKARMESAVCPDKLCVNQGEINKTGEVVVCLPQKIILEVK